MTQDIDVRILSDHTFFLTLYYDLQYVADRFLQEIVSVGLDKTLAHPHLKHQHSPILRICLKEVEKIPDEFSNLVESPENPLEVQFELSAEFFRFFDGD